MPETPQWPIDQNSEAKQKHQLSPTYKNQIQNRARIYNKVPKWPADQVFKITYDIRGFQKQQNKETSTPPH